MSTSKNRLGLQCKQPFHKDFHIRRLSKWEGGTAPHITCVSWNDATVKAILSPSHQDILSELLIPYHTVNAGRRVPVVEYSMSKSLHRYTTDRQGLLSKCTAIDGDTAKKLLDHGYKQLSKFKRWCPVKVSTDSCVLCHHLHDLDCSSRLFFLLK